MATVRKLITKLSFEADTSQADKFERVIIGLKNKVNELNRALKGKGETDGRKKQMNRLAQAFKNLKSKIESTKIGQAVKGFGKRILKATKEFSSVILPKIRKIGSQITGVFSGIAQKIKNNKLKIIGAIVAAAAAIRSATLRSATVETLRVDIIGEFGVEGAKELDKQIEKIKKDLKIGELFSEEEIKQGIVTAIQLGVDPKTISKLIQDALLAAATTPGASFEEAMAAFTTFTFTGDEASLAKFGTFNRRQIEAIKLARREASNFTNERKTQILLQATQLKRGENIKQLERVLGTTSAKIGKTSGEIADSWLKAGDFIKDGVNIQLENTEEILKRIKELGFIEGLAGFQQKAPIGAQSKDVKPGEEERLPSLRDSIDSLNNTIRSLLGKAPREGGATKEESPGSLSKLADKENRNIGLFGLILKALGVKTFKQKQEEKRKTAERTKEVHREIIDRRELIKPEVKPAEKLRIIEKIKTEQPKIIKEITKKSKPDKSAIAPPTTPKKRPIENLIGKPATPDKIPISEKPGTRFPSPSNVTNNEQSSNITVNQKINIDGNVTDISAAQMNRVTKQLQVAIMANNQLTFGANANQT